MALIIILESILQLAERFRAPILCILSIVVGVALGWWPGYNQNNPERLPFTKGESAPSNDHTMTTVTDVFSSGQVEIAPGIEHSAFFQALDSEQFDNALTIFQQYARYSPDTAASLYVGLIHRARQYHNDGTLEPAIKLLELFTEYYDEDIELLTELAECYIAANQLSKALEVYASARSYSVSRKEIRALDQQIHQISHVLYERHKELSNLKDIIPVFLRLSYLEPDHSFYRLVLAEGYLMHNDTQSAIRELQMVLMDNEFKEAAARHLARLLPVAQPEEPEEPDEKTIVPLSGTSGHFIVDTIAGSNHHNRLLIDTGSSLTTLPRHTLTELLNQQQASRIGYIDLTTASGIYRSPLYRLKQLKIGDFSINNLETAEFGPINQNVDGLLGMNALSHFNFFIDQNRQQLSLMPRQME